MIDNKIKNIDKCDTPAILVYKEVVMRNIERMLKMVNGDSKRLMPHVKTNKTPEVVKLMLAQKINKFKASTLSEAEMCLKTGAKEVLIAHQLVGPKIERFIQLALLYKESHLSFIVDSEWHAKVINTIAKKHGVKIKLYIDVDNGMHRSGIDPAGIDSLLNFIQNCSHLELIGLHIYDGQHRDKDFETRKNKIAKDLTWLQKYTLPKVIGGTPSFSIHANQQNLICSPGTCVFWDWGYNEILKEQEFDFAALVATRVISKPKKNTLTIDLGHKAIAAENPIDKRIHFLDIGQAHLLSQSEEHGVLLVENGNKFEIGDVIYGIPYHVCPTVNLYEELTVISQGNIIDYWTVTARKRKITC